MTEVEPREMRVVEDDEWDVAVDIGSGVRMLQSTTGRRWLVEHRCKTVHGYRLVIAPALDDGHQVQTVDPLTITPSIGCECGLHGHVTDGRWVAC